MTRLATRTLLIRTNPLALLAVGLLSIVSSLTISSLTEGLAACLGYGLAALVLLPSWRVLTRRLFAVGLAALSITYSTWLLGGHQLTPAATAGLKIIVLALPGAVAAAYIDPSRLADQLGQRLRLPARPVVAFAAALQRFERLGDTWQQLSRTRRARGLAPGRHPLSAARHAGSLTFGLLVSSLRDASSMSIAMDARGFADAGDRTWAEPAPWTRLDTGMVMAGVIVASIPAVVGQAL